MGHSIDFIRRRARGIKKQAELDFADFQGKELSVPDLEQLVDPCCRQDFFDLRTQVA